MISAITQAHLDQTEKSKSTDSGSAIYNTVNSFGGRDKTYSKRINNRNDILVCVMKKTRFD